MAKQVRLKNNLLGHPPFDRKSERRIREGSEVEITNPDYSDTESEVTYDGVALVVNKESLITFEEHD